MALKNPMEHSKEIRLPCHGIIVTLWAPNQDGAISGTITSDLKEPEDMERDTDEVNRRERYNSAIDGLESFILAAACAGIDIQSKSFTEAINTAVDAIASHCD